LSSYIIKSKNTYYALFQEIREKGIWENWVLYILDGIEVTSKQTLKKIKTIQDLLESSLEKIKKICPKIYSKELEEHDYLTHLQIGKEILYINKDLMAILKK
jgi:Fic family protein